MLGILFYQTTINLMQKKEKFDGRKPLMHVVT